MKDSLLSARKVSKKFNNIDDDSLVLEDIDVDIYKGDFTVLMGASGAGKSTLLYVLSGIDNITNGKVFYKEKEISKLRENEMSFLRGNEFGFIFQQSNLVSNLTLSENIFVAGCLSNKIKRRNVREKSKELLKKMNLEKAMNRLPSKVSGGESQRAAVARAVISSPEIIFADEPTGALNKRNTEEVLNLLSKLNEEGQSILMVTHDIRAAIRGNRLLYMEDGKIIEEKEMTKYTTEYSREREAEITDWLIKMEW